MPKEKLNSPRLVSLTAGDQTAHFSPDTKLASFSVGGHVVRIAPDGDESAPEVKPEVTMLLPNGVDGLCKLFADGRPVLAGSLREACGALKTLGLQPGDTYTLCRPDIGIEQVIRYRTAAERAAGMPVTVSRKPIQQEG